MISQKENPVEWALLLYELNDLEEHCANLLTAMAEEGSIEVEDFHIQVAHLYAHLNRVWNSRNHVGEASDKVFQKFSEFPIDIEPVG